MPNRLAGETSPYLLQHAENPIDWWPWCPEAFERAREREVPILLSIGYASCHWCHVMAHESFSDSKIAALVNDGFVAVKVDREERPDVDAVYLAATQAMTGSGGWPMTCFLTPDGRPFHCGTYYPPEPRPGVPGFGQLLAAVRSAWAVDADTVRAKADQLTTALASVRSMPTEPVGEQALAAAVEALSADFDEQHGGFGTGQKFPPSMVLEFLLRHHERTGSAEALRLTEQTCERMARGGLHDQLAGGFARYTVDREWAVPHFEKMLYDNALLMRVYAHLARRTGSELARRVTEDTAGFLLRELRTGHGAFAASLDADTEGVEGATYVWSPGQLRDVLGEADGKWAAELLRVGGPRASAPQLPADPGDLERWNRVRAALRAARGGRPQPSRDDKVVTSWNGLAIGAFAEAGAVWGRDDWIAAADQAAAYLLDRHVIDGRLRRASRDGVTGTAVGVLDDYGCFADGLLVLHQVTAGGRWLDAALGLLDTALEHFAADEGGFFDTADDAEILLRRPRDPRDVSSPSGGASLAGALLTASVLAPARSAARYGAAAVTALASAGGVVRREPRLTGHWLAVAEAAARGPLQVAVVGAPGDAGCAALTGAARRAAPGGSVVVSGTPDQAGVPLLAGRPLVGDGAAAYVCRGYVCQRPARETRELVAALSARP